MLGLLKTRAAPWLRDQARHRDGDVGLEPCGGRLHLFRLEKMAAEGLIEESETRREGNRPSRTVYRITETGRTCFSGCFGSLVHPDSFRFSWILGLLFCRNLDTAETKLFLESRISQLEGILKGLFPMRRPS
jgi:hypothetical protein